MPRPWPTALIKVAVNHAWPSSSAAETAKFQDAMWQLTSAFSARPFGDPKAVAAAARTVSVWANDLAKKLQDPATKYTERDARKLLEALGNAADPMNTDHDSARQIAWAFRIIYSQLNPPPANDAAVKKKLEELDKELVLELPSRQDREILKELPHVLERIREFDPAKFHAAMNDLAELLK
jgi:hypothetical protein